MKLHSCSASVFVLLATMFAIPAAARDRVYRNAEFELQEVFPAGVKVCTALSGNHPHGFYGRIGSVPGNCGSTSGGASSMGVYAQWNAEFQKTPFDELPAGCRRPRPNAYVSPAELKSLRIPGVRSIACATDREGAPIGIEVVAMGGKWPNADPSGDVRTPAIIYSAALGTGPKHLRRDLAMFRRFLASMRVLKPVSGDDSQCAPCLPF